MGYEEIVESRIQDAMAAGAFRNLAGEGRPFAFRPGDHHLAGDDWAGFRILENGGMLPAWLMLARDVEALETRLAALDARHAALAAAAQGGAGWGSLAPAIRHARTTFESTARALREKQDRFNHDAPSIALERPAIWVEHHLARLDDRLREAGAPAWLLLPRA